jgi:hypothetical protein
MSTPEVNCRRKGIVSVWVGSFPSLEEAEAYFGIPDEIGVYLPPERFARDLGLEDLPAECLEVNFENLSPRPLAALLKDATYSASFLDKALEAARQLGIQMAQGIALLYDFDYQAKADRQPATGPVRFLGSFPYAGTSSAEEQSPRRDPRFIVRELMDDLL